MSRTDDLPCYVSQQDSIIFFKHIEVVLGNECVLHWYMYDTIKIPHHPTI